MEAAHKGIMYRLLLKGYHALYSEKDAVGPPFFNMYIDSFSNFTVMLSSYSPSFLIFTPKNIRG